MFKLNKNTHMMILMSFTVVFVVVYMYYAIKDIKKIYADVKKIEADLVTTKTKVDVIESETKAIKQVLSSPPPMPPQEMYEMIFPMPASSSQPVCQPPMASDDNDSVTTEDIKKLVPDDEEPEVQSTPVQEVAQEVVEEPSNEVVKSEDKSYTEEELKKMKFEEIKDICKKMNINIKGTKEVLISRILTEKNIS